ncbi:MAG: quinone-dependent dihydroorotate dehydrogenase [Proteobacteria bacterium]|nr:quinone-dependent dihydroorotate dehydrogenase [Pseudomonadota bacterium]
MLMDVGAGFLRLLPAETAHRATVRLLRTVSPLIPRASTDDPRLAIHLWGKRFANPIGLAAGFDKDAEVPDAMLKLGLGFVECGTVTPRPQSGNPRPRLFRLVEDRAVINRMGFNNQGMARAVQRLGARKRRGIVGINIGANKNSQDRIADYVMAFEILAPLADYVTLNISSPNTPGLRGLQNRDELQRLLDAVIGERARIRAGVPILVKLAPDLDEAAMDDIAQAVRASQIDGLILTNTTVVRPITLRSAYKGESGGLSGKPLFTRSTDVLAAMYRRLDGALPIIGAGGISSGTDAYAKIRKGASLVQLYSALAFEGPGLIGRIKTELSALLVRDGFASVAEAVGAAFR